MKYQKFIECEKNAPVYSKRIAQLLNEQNLTQEDLATMSGVSKSSITAWISGDKNGKRTEPKIIGLNDVAKVLGVSTDYLLGNTNIKKPNIELQAIEKYTGLSEKAIETVSTVSKSHKVVSSALNFFIASEKFSLLIFQIQQYQNQMDLLKEYEKVMLKKLDECDEKPPKDIVSFASKIRLSPDSYIYKEALDIIDIKNNADFILYQTQNTIKDILETYKKGR